MTRQSMPKVEFNQNKGKPEEEGEAEDEGEEEVGGEGEGVAEGGEGSSSGKKSVTKHTGLGRRRNYIQRTLARVFLTRSFFNF